MTTYDRALRGRVTQGIGPNGETRLEGGLDGLPPELLAAVVAATAADALHPLPYISRDQQAAEQGRARTKADHKRIGERIDATLRARRGEQVVDEAAAAAALRPDPAEMDVSALVLAAFPDGPGAPMIGWDGEALGAAEEGEDAGPSRSPRPVRTFATS